MYVLCGRRYDFKIVKNILDDVRKNTEVEDDGIEETIAQMHGTEMTIENVNKVFPYV